MTPLIYALTLNAVGDIATAVAAVATIALLAAAIWAGRTAERSIAAAADGVRSQIDEQRTIEGRRRAYDHLGTFNSHEFTKMSAEAAGVFLAFKGSEPASAAWQKISGDDKVTVQTVLNFYEEIANEYNAGFLDPEAAKPLVFVAVLMYQQGEGLIEWLREADGRYLDQWAALYRAESPSLLPIANPVDDGGA